jgi:hypothetical protein
VSFGSLRALAFGISQAVHGVPATVTRPAPDNTPIVTTVIWAVAPVSDGQPYGSMLHRVDSRKVMAISRSDVPTLDMGTMIVAAEIDGDAAKTWVVDGIERALADQWRAFVKLKN